jgi:hypothetical protein
MIKDRRLAARAKELSRGALAADGDYRYTGDLARMAPKNKRYLIHDRDPLYTRSFLDILADAGIKSVKLPPRSPNLNAFADIRAVDQGRMFGANDFLR